MADNQYQSTSDNIFLSTSDNIWYGAEVESISDIEIEYAVRKFYCTLTGSADATTDIEIPISSFQGRRRNSNPTYLSVVTHDTTYADAIAARPNGEIYIEMAYNLNGTETSREEIIRAELESVTYDEGSSSQAITLSGHKTEAWIGKNITLTGQTYKRITDSSYLYRFSDFNVYLRPGDTVTVDDDTFTPDLVSMTVAATDNGINAQIEVSD